MSNQTIAQQELALARHIVAVTYPALRDSKLLILALNHIDDALKHTRRKIALRKEITQLAKTARDCPLEFRRGEAYVLCKPVNGEYRIIKVTKKVIVDYINQVSETIQ
jgi:hypothetical protein